MVCQFHNSSISINCLKNIFTSPFRHKCLWIIATLLVLFYTCTGNNINNHDFEYLIFSQRWLPSACINYLEKNPRKNHCDMPDEYDFWAIHGLWPTKPNEYGPYFCNTSMPFDLKNLHPIFLDLEKYWPNIESGENKYSLWKHEWLKHGTCAVQLEALNTELKYFNVTLGYFNHFNLKNIFKQYNIVPSNDYGYRVLDLFYILTKTFGKNPNIHCITEVKTRQSYLSEIRLCFDKSLELMDCEDINNEKPKFSIKKNLTNCPMNALVLFPETFNVPSKSKKLQRMQYYDPLIAFLNIIQFLQWASI